MKSALLLATAAAVLLGGASGAHATLGFTNFSDPLATGASTVASGINDSGEVVGSYADTTTTHGFYLNGGGFTTVDVSNSAATVASGVNNAGLITGSYTDNTLSAGQHGFLTPTDRSFTLSFDNSGAAAAGATFGSATNASNTTVGYYTDSAGATHAFVGAATVDYPGAVNITQAFGINDSGTAVGAYSDGTFMNGFVDAAGSLSTVDDPLGLDGTVLTGIDARGDLVGYYLDGGGTAHGFVEVVGTNVFITVDDPSADDGTEVLGVNDDDMIVGSFVAGGITQAFEAYDSDLPEPGTFALFGLAALGVGALRRRRSRAI